MWNDFKEFIARGNLLDLAIGFIMGAAFSSLVKTFTEGIVMPFVGLATGGIDFTKMYYDLSGKYNNLDDPEKIQAAIESGAPLVMYGQFIADIINFLIVALVMFLLARWALKLFKALEPESAPSPEVELLTDIRDALQNK